MSGQPELDAHFQEQMERARQHALRGEQDLAWAIVAKVLRQHAAHVRHHADEVATALRKLANLPDPP